MQKYKFLVIFGGREGAFNSQIWAVLLTSIPLKLHVKYESNPLSTLSSGKVGDY